MSDPRNPDGSYTPPGGRGPAPGAGSTGGFTGGAPPKAPPVPTSKTKAQQYYDWAKQHGVQRQVAIDVWFWAHKVGQNVGGDPFAYYWTAVLLRESNADKKQGLNASGHGFGIGQINPSVWVGTLIPWDKAKRKFTNDADPETGIQSYNVNLRLSGTYLASNVSLYGYNHAYAGLATTPGSGYNHGASGPGADIASITKTVPKGIVFAPTEGAGPSTPNPGSSAPAPFNDPYVAGVMLKGAKQGKFSTTNDPTKALQYNGVPLTRSAFLSIKSGLTSWYVSYTGQNPSNQQVQAYIKNGWNTYTLAGILSQSAAFTKSPIFKQWSTNYNAAVKDVLPPGQSVPVDIIRQGILNHWDGNALAAKLRKLPTYLQSNEFKGNIATLYNVHSSIMGVPDASGMITVKDAALAGWSTDQYAAYLRSQPSYSTSPEYQTKALGLLSSLGLITGARPVISTAPNVGPGPGRVDPKTQGNIPVDPRVKGNPNASTPGPLAGMGVTLA